MEDLNSFRLLYTCDSVDRIPYVNALTASNVLKLRGGNETVGLIVAIYKILSIIEKYPRLAIPETMLYPFAGSIVFRNKHS